jgi:hypothetical protein
VEARVSRPFRIGRVRRVEVGEDGHEGVAGGHQREQDARDEQVVEGHVFPLRLACFSAV